MKIRQGFVSNSSSTSFMITNLTDKEKTLVDFVTETPWIVEKYISTYNIGKNKWMSQEKLLDSAKENNIIFAPNESKICCFGDEQGTLIGEIYDYMLRGEDLSWTEQLLKKIEEEKDPEKQKQLSEEWIKSLDNAEDKFSGVDSPSFKVRFHEWLR